MTRKILVFNKCFTISLHFECDSSAMNSSLEISKFKLKPPFPCRLTKIQLCSKFIDLILFQCFIATFCLENFIQFFLLILLCDGIRDICFMIYEQLLYNR